MARERNPKSIKAEKLYIGSKGSIELIEIAKQLNIPEGTVRSWKNRYKWDSKLKGESQQDNATLQSQEENKCNVAIVKANEKAMDEEIIIIENDDLNERQKLFCSYYVKYRNKTKAYMKAYQSSYENANANAYKQWENMGIKREIEKQLKELRDNIGLDARDLIQKYMDIAFADINDFMDFGIKEVELPDKETGGVRKIMFNYVDFKNSCDVDGTLISQVKQGKDGVSIKLHDKMKAYEWLGKHIDLLDTATKERLRIENEKLKLEERKVVIAEKQVDDLDEDIEYIVEEGEENENQEKDQA